MLADTSFKVFEKKQCITYNYLFFFYKLAGKDFLLD